LTRQSINQSINQSRHTYRCI